MNVEPISRQDLGRLLDEETFDYERNPEWERVVNVRVVDAAQAILDAPPLEWCAQHEAPRSTASYCLARLVLGASLKMPDPCQFETYVRVKVSE